MKKSHRTASSLSIPEELLIEIFSLLPLRSLHKFKYLSKSFSSLITCHVLPRIPPSPLLGFFSGTTPLLFHYHPDHVGSNDTIDPTLSFLCVRHHRSISIRDCCNGLVLCSYVNTLHAHRRSDGYLVCNPATKSWTLWTVPLKIGHGGICMKIDFDPQVSPHYKIVTMNLVNNQTQVMIKVFYSETKRYEQKQKTVDSRVFADGFQCTLWNQALYVYSYHKPSQRFLEGDFSRDDFLTTRFRLLEGDHHEVIEFPLGTTMPAIFGPRIGTMGNKLCFAGTNGLRLRIWTLREKHDNEWMLDHDPTLSCLSGYGTPKDHLYVVGFHPSLDMVFIQYNHVILSYDIDRMTPSSIYQIGSEGRRKFLRLLIPFSPCSLDLLESRNEAQDA